MGLTGAINGLRKRCKHHNPPILAKKKCRKVAKGCTNQTVDLLELTWHRGYASPNLSNENLPNDAKCFTAAKHVPQSKTELSKLEVVTSHLGASMRLAPNSHCEFLGQGVDHAWGVSNVYFRRENAALDNDKRVAICN